VDLNIAAATAVHMMHEHGLTDWRFEWDRAVRRVGACNYRRRVISLSRPLTERAPADIIRNTILHEIAHALVGRGHGHDWVWKLKARSIGCTGDRCSALNVQIEGKWQAVCPSCSRVFHRHRQPKDGKRWCAACGPQRGLISYARAS
jgi:predicted SprT family Zn-dependent metalloprotease